MTNLQNMPQDYNNQTLVKHLPYTKPKPSDLEEIAP
jgi:hypothetical protein